MSWTNEHIGIILEEYEKYPQLYHITHPEYFNKVKRSMYLQKIASALEKIRPNTTEIDVSKKLAGLRNTYACERKKYLESCNKDEKHVYTPSLWYYEKLEFLNAHLGARKAKSNLSTSQQSEFVNMPEESDSNDPDFDSTSEDELKFPADPFVADEEPTTLVQTTTTMDTSLVTSTRKRIRYNEEESQPTADVKHPISTKQPLDDDWIYCKYVVARLACITNSRRKLRVKHKIDTLLYEAMVEEYS